MNKLFLACFLSMGPATVFAAAVTLSGMSSILDGKSCSVSYELQDNQITNFEFQGPAEMFQILEKSDNSDYPYLEVLENVTGDEYGEFVFNMTRTKFMSATDFRGTQESNEDGIEGKFRILITGTLDAPKEIDFYWEGRVLKFLTLGLEKFGCVKL